MSYILFAYMLALAEAVSQKATCDNEYQFDVALSSEISSVADNNRFSQN